MNMTPETQTEDMSMEDILSSIKDILESDSQEQHAEAQASAEPQTISAQETTPVAADVKPAMQSAEDAEEEDVFDLSKSMIIDEPETPSAPATELDETGPDFEINTASEDPLLTPDDTKLPDFDEIDQSESSSILANAQNEEDDALSLNIDEILQSASETIAEDNNSFATDDDIASAFSYDKEISSSEDIKLPEIDVDSEPIFENTSSEEDEQQPAEDALPVQMEEPKEMENTVEPEIVADATPEPAQENQALPEPEVEEVEPVVEEVSEVEENIEPMAQEDIKENIPEPKAMSETKVASQVEQTTAPKSEKSDAADVSADIISNFAKMFAEQSQENKERANVASNKAESREPISVSGMGDGSKTIEQVVEDVIQGIVASSVSAEMTKNVDIVAYAKKEIHAQTRAWLEANLPAIVEAAVQKEIERVMVKVGH